MSFSDAIQTCFQKYVTFDGRAGRSEYWYWVLFIFVVQIAISFLESLLRMGSVLTTLFGLAVFLPGLAVTVRRLHDVGRPGWWLLVMYVPALIGAFFLGFAMAAIVAAVFGGGAGVAIGAVGVLSALIGLVIVAGGVAFWVYTLARIGDAGPNAYGPPPGMLPAQA